ncbi:MAG: hypothetical protein KF832_26145 [Caldilineaceae bacterium]|nr:hypothetical protein [Caldilineaceae bacterium]
MRKGVKRSVALLLSILLLVCSVMPTFAQELPEPFCGDLDAEDCDILIASQEAMTTVGSGVYSSEINFLLAGIPGLPLDEVSFSLTQDATYAIDPELALQLAEMQTLPPEELAENMEAMVDLLLEVYATLAYQGEMHLTLPADVAELIAAQAQVPVPEEITVNIVVADGYGYINLDDLAALAPGTEGLEGWAGIDLLTLMKAGLEESAASSGDMSSMAGFGVSNFLTTEEGRAMIEPYISVEREDDGAVDGQDLAVFQSTFNLGAFVGSPLFRDLLISQLDTINALAETELTEQELTESLTMLSFVAPMLFAGLDFHTSQSIGVDDLFVYENDFVFAWDLSSLVAVARMVDSDGSMGLSTLLGNVEPVINLEVITSASDHNNAPEITAPEEAQIIPLEALQ